MATKKQIIERALIRVGALDSLQTMTAQQESDADTTLQSIHEQMVNDELVRWELDAVPQAVEEPLVSVLALALANDYGVSDTRYTRLVAANLQGIRRLAAYNELPYSGTAEIAAY